VLIACAAAVLAVSREAEATFPGKNGKIAYVAWGFTSAAAEIYTINPGRGGKTQITHSYNATEFSPSYSPNGKKIAYTAPEGVDWDGSDSEIYTINAGGGGKIQLRGGKIQLTHNNTEDYDPSYSPDGKKIVYGNDGELYTIDVRTGHRVQLTHNNKADYDPDYSPDGKRIAYTGSDTFGDLNVDKAESDIYTIKAGGGDKTHVTNTDNVDEFQPSYSPDGKKIALNVYKGNDEIYTIDVGGGGKTNLTNTDNVDEYMPSWGSRP